MNSFKNLGGDPSKLRARQGSKNLAWQCLRDGKGVDQVALGWSFGHLQRKSWTKTTKKKNERAKEERRTKSEYKMRVFGERDTGGWQGGSVERDERIVEFETTLRKEKGRRKQRGIQSSVRRTIGWEEGRVEERREGGEGAQRAQNAFPKTRPPAVYSNRMWFTAVDNL